jgi:hypothetical protein
MVSSKFGRDSSPLLFVQSRISIEMAKEVSTWSKLQNTYSKAIAAFRPHVASGLSRFRRRFVVSLMRISAGV